MASLFHHDPWYKDGLRFACTQCGNCCSGEPGYVWVTRDDIARIAAFRGQRPDDLSRRFVRRVGVRHSLTEKPNGDCVFLVRENGKAICGIYPVRPLQCRTWPFWSENLRTPADWAATAQGCPGLNKGRLYSLNVVESLRRGKPGEAADEAPCAATEYHAPAPPAPPDAHRPPH